MARTISMPMGRMREVRLLVSRGIRPRELAVPSLSAKELFPNPLDVRLIDLDQIDGNTTLQEQVLIVSLAKQQRARKVFELGTFDGKTTANLATNLGEEAEIITIDLKAD